MALNLEEELAALKLCVEGELFPSRSNQSYAKSKNTQIPVIPKSCAVKSQREPSYTSPLHNKKISDNPIYSNISPDSIKTSQIVSKSSESGSKDVLYSNIQISSIPRTFHIYNNVNTYSNIPPYSKRHREFPEDIPPPPKELPDFMSCNASSFPPPPDDLPPPPSPVSSSYSELRRAAHFQSPDYSHAYSTYAPLSVSSSTYESIYEPIIPRPPSEISSRSNYSLYGSASTAAQGRPSSMCHDATTDEYNNILVHSMSPSLDDSDSFGTCCKCGQKIFGEGSGCSAMNKMYHIKCFTCCHCDTLLEGKPFYQLDGNPYCEQGYLETLEKCSVCQKPILDRILRATGHPYHPQCFTCVVCHKSLDGITFTVDAANQIHCIEDFHRKFAPRCCVCKEPIMPEPGKEETVRAVALDRSFHIECYKCEDCGLVLSSEADGRGCYPLDDHVLCKSCNATRVQALTSVMTTDL